MAYPKPLEARPGHTWDKPVWIPMGGPCVCEGCMPYGFTRSLDGYIVRRPRPLQEKE